MTLNRSVGGVNPDAVERSAQAGGRMIWFPTLEARAYQPTSTGMTRRPICPAS